MADNKITFSLGSAFSGEGFNKATNALGRTADKAGKTGGAFSRMGSALGNSGKSILKNLVNIQAGITMLSGAMQKIAGLVMKAFEFEKTTVQFKTLIGDMDAAREHMQMLKDLGNTPPFGLDEFAAASRSLMVMSDGTLGYKKSLEMIGDAAAATGQPLESVSQSVGQMYALIRDGEPIGRAATQLRNVGILSPEVCAKLEDMQRAGAKSSDIWNEVENALSKYKGAMAETESTGSGLIGAISSRWDNIVRQFGEAFSGDVKGGMSQVLGVAKDLEESGLVELWATKAAEGVAKLVEVAKYAFGWLSKVKGLYSDVTDFLERAGTATGSMIGGMIGGGSWKEITKNAVANLQAVEREQKDRKDEDARIQKEAAEKIKKARIEAEKKAAQDEIAERKRIAEQLDAADKKNAEKRAKNAEKRAKNAEKDEEKARRERAAAAAKAAKEEAQKNEKNARDTAKNVIKKIDNQIAGIDAEIKGVDSSRADTKKGIEADKKYHRGIGGNGYDKYATDESGVVNNFKDFSRAERYLARAKRDQETQDKNFDARTKQKYEDLQKKDRNKLSKRDRDFLEKYGKFDKSRKDKQKLEDEKKALQEKKEAARQKLQNDVAQIKENLKRALEAN